MFAIFMGVAPDMYWLSTDFSKILDSNELKCLDIVDTIDGHAAMYCSDRYSPVTHRTLIHLYVMVYVVFVTAFLVCMRFIEGFFSQKSNAAERQILKRKRKSKSGTDEVESRVVYGFHYIGCIM